MKACQMILRVLEQSAPEAQPVVGPKDFKTLVWGEYNYNAWAVVHLCII